MPDIKGRNSIHQESIPNDRSIGSTNDDSIEESTSSNETSEYITSPGNSTTHHQKHNLSRSAPNETHNRKRNTHSAAKEEGDTINKSHLSQSYSGLNDSHEEIKTKGSSSNLYIYLSIFCAILLSIAIACVLDLKAYVGVKKICSYEKLQVRYPEQDKFIWTVLQVGIENILNGESDKPAVYLFLHNGQIKTFIKDIAELSSSCFDMSSEPVQMKLSDFTSENASADHGHVINNYKMKVREGNVILIVNLNEIPAEAAQALHFICDTYNPIVHKVIIFLTLATQHQTEGNHKKIAENSLEQLWGDKLKSDVLDALITRLTDQILQIK